MPTNTVKRLHTYILLSSLLLLPTLTACGGGGGSTSGNGGTSGISVGSLTYEPNGAYVGGPSSVTVSGTLAVSSPANAATLQARLIASNGQVAGQVVVPIQQAPNPTGAVSFSITVSVLQLTLGAYTLEFSVATSSGARSNLLTGPFAVLPNPWSALPAMPTSRTAFALSELSGRIYVIGGSVNQTTPSTVVEVYDPLSNTWATAPQPAVSRTGASATAAGGRIFLIGGANIASPGGVAEVEVFDPTSNVWSFGSPQPTPRSDAAIAVVGGTIYLIGGIAGSAYLATVEALDIAANSWSSATSLPSGRAMSAATVANGAVYLSGGRSSPISLDASLFAYDPASGIWNTFNGFNRTIYTRAAHALVAVDGNLIAIGGETTAGPSPTDTVEASALGANLTSDLQWRLRAPLPQVDTYVRAVAVGGRIYVITPSQAWLYDPALDVL